MTGVFNHFHGRSVEGNTSQVTKNFNMFKSERWRLVSGQSGKYAVSSKGRFISRCNNRGGISNKWHKVKVVVNKSHGYSQVVLNKKVCRFHRIVALTFIPNPENKPDVNHKYGNKQDNRAEALEWCTKKENEQHSRKTGLNSCKPSAKCKARSIEVCKKKVFDSATGITYDSAKAAAIGTGIKRSTLIGKLCGFRNNNTTLKYID